MQKMFERDLKNVLDTLEKLCHGKANHADYVMAYDYFMSIWSPDAHVMMKHQAAMGFREPPSR